MSPKNKETSILTVLENSCHCLVLRRPSLPFHLCDFFFYNHHHHLHPIRLHLSFLLLSSPLLLSAACSGILRSILLFLVRHVRFDIPHTSGRYSSSSSDSDSSSLGQQINYVLLYDIQRVLTILHRIIVTNHHLSPLPLAIDSFIVSRCRSPTNHKKSNFTLQYSVEEQDSLPLYAILKFQLN